jgi:hypothetical protein
MMKIVYVDKYEGLIEIKRKVRSEKGNLLRKSCVPS